MQLHGRAVAAGVGVIAFPAVGQRTTDYEDVRAEVAATPTGELRFVGCSCPVMPEPCAS